jgi:hypothetical protein
MSTNNQEEQICQSCDCSIALVQPLFEIPIKLDECPICYEPMDMVNFTVARCGHMYHSSCIFKALDFNTDCPLCRVQLIDREDEESSSIDDEDYDDDDDDDDDDDENEAEDIEDDAQYKVTSEQLAEKLTNLGYTLKDVLKLYNGRALKSSTTKKYTKEYLTLLDDRLEGILEGKISLSERDTRSYADVVRRS